MIDKKRSFDLVFKFLDTSFSFSSSSSSSTCCTVTLTIPLPTTLKQKLFFVVVSWTDILVLFIGFKPGRYFP